jgi:hypothetical protein
MSVCVSVYIYRSVGYVCTVHKVANPSISSTAMWTLQAHDSAHIMKSFPIGILIFSYLISDWLHYHA